MLNVLIAGVGGQGSVLAARILAQAATEKGWKVRTAETIGMAQRGGNVTSHVRMGDAGEPVFAPLVAEGTADVVIALEPGEGIRALPYLATDGLMVCASTPIASVAESLSSTTYRADGYIAELRARVSHFHLVDDEALCASVGSRKVLNVCMLAAAVSKSIELDCGLRAAVSVDDLKTALRSCVKERFIDMNIAAVDAVVS